MFNLTFHRCIRRINKISKRAHLQMTGASFSAISRNLNFETRRCTCFICKSKLELSFQLRKHGSTQIFRQGETQFGLISLFVREKKEKRKTKEKWIDIRRNGNPIQRSRNSYLFGITLPRNSAKFKNFCNLISSYFSSQSRTPPISHCFVNTREF